jgi:hypothetical protein
MLAPTLSDASDLLNKLNRELHRAIHHRHPLHKADHLYNFCITAHALRDYFFEAKGIVTDKAKKAPYHKSWEKIPELVAAGEIANSAKHFVLREPRTRSPITSATQAVSASTVTHIQLLFNKRGELLQIAQESDAPDWVVKMPHGKRWGLHAFMSDVAHYWREFLVAEGIPIQSQTEPELLGIAPEPVLGLLDPQAMHPTV